MEIPRHWRLKGTRLKLQRPLLLEASDYRIVDGFGNGSSMHIISKTGGDNLHVFPSEKPLYPNTLKAKSEALPIEVASESVFKVKKTVKI